MGDRAVPKETLFYSFNLERHIRAGDLLGSIDRFVDLSEELACTLLANGRKTPR
jgi:hypothetical protein